MNELEIIEHRQIEGLTAFVNTVDFRSSHIHPEWEIILVLDEPLSVTCGQSQFEVHPGQTVLFNPNEPHDFRKIEKSCTFLCVQIPTKIPSLPPKLLVEQKIQHWYLEGVEYNETKKRLTDLMLA